MLAFEDLGQKDQEFEASMSYGMNNIRKPTQQLCLKTKPVYLFIQYNILRHFYIIEWLPTSFINLCIMS